MYKDFSTMYRSGEGIFGARPEPVLAAWVDHIPTFAPVLDLGCGQGRNSLYVAKKGLTVMAVDPVPEAVTQTLENAKQANLELFASVATFQNYSPTIPAFGAILAFGLIPILTREDIRLLTERMMEWTCPGSLMFITALTSVDSSFKRYSESGKQIGELSFILDKGTIRTFLLPGEILLLFRDVEVIYHREEIGPWHRHGDSLPERHAWAHLVAKRK